MFFAVVLGLLVLIAVLSLVRWYATTDVKNLKRTLGLAGLGLLAVGVVVLAATGRMGAAMAGLAGLVVWAGRIINLLHMGRQFGGLFGARRGAPPAPGPAMTEEEALRILGLAPGATPEEIKAAHRRIIEQIHPDRGGSDYLAAKVNIAKDFLLKTQGHT